MDTPEQTQQHASRRGKKILFIAGLVVYFLGLYLLTFVNSMADNWAGVVAPLCIIGGLVTIFVSLVLRPGESPNEEDSPDGTPAA